MLATCLLTLLAVGTSARGKDDTTPGVGVAVGDTLCRPDGKAWSAAGSYAIIIVTPCLTCAGRGDIEDDLYDYAIRQHVPIYQVFGSGSSQRQATAREGLIVLRADLNSFGVSRPTIFRVNGQGVVQSMWTGTVPGPIRASVFRSLTTGVSLEKYESMTEVDFAGRSLDERARILSLGDRAEVKSSRQPHVVIRLNELAARSPSLLSGTREVFVLCSTASSLLKCQDAAIILSKLGFPKVVAVGIDPRQHKLCVLGATKQ